MRGFRICGHERGAVREAKPAPPTADERP